MIEKGGESMSLEAMKQVTEAEEANRARRAEAQAEAKAAEHASEVMAQTRKSCDALRAQAEARLADAAESIVRRVVKTNVHC